MKRTVRIVILIVASSLSVWLFFINTTSITESQTVFLGQSDDYSPQDLTVKMPDPGTYTLHKIFSVPELTVLDSTGTLQPISKYTKGKITLLTFFYQRCSDADGCPYAMALFHRVKSKLDRDENLRDRMRFVHISFDPNRDTPIMMAGLEKQIANLHKDKKSIEWDFLTTSSVDELLPVIDAFGQNVDIDVNALTKDKVLNYSHVLKAFLIDEEGFVREIYSTTYISKEMLLNDIETVSLSN
jgi:cytochrome oxidase Cu insertion factor (SCO1/SenC/PrrC family)|tara:strand:- start:1522 stop:2247 length:726 start_codon:yes stop_codon:yes gene_type:complete